MTWTQEDRARLAANAASRHYGFGNGYRDLQLATQHEDAGWRALAVEHEAARRRLNALLPPTAVQRRSADGVAFLGDHTRFDSAAVQDALQAYRLICAEALTAPRPKPRRIPTLIRLAAEIAGAPDPVWSAADWGGGVSAADIAFNKLLRQTQAALYRASRS